MGAAKSPEHRAKIAAALRHTSLPESKVCSTCRRDLPAAAFGTRSRSEFLLRGACRECENRKSRAWRHANKSKVSEMNRVATLRRRGIDSAEYDRLLAAQGGGCGICGGPPGRRSFAVDHDHETGRIRGLLCDTCNRGIGLLGDTADRLREALEYLTHSAPVSGRRPPPRSRSTS